jgi:hypothetical protein
MKIGEICKRFNNMVLNLKISSIYTHEYKKAFEHVAFHNAPICIFFSWIEFDFNWIQIIYKQ